MRSLVFSSSSCFSRRISVGSGPSYFILPIEVGRLADPGLPADLRHRHAIIALLQDERPLRLRKPRCLHRSPLLPSPGKQPENSSQKRSCFQGAEHHLDLLGPVLQQPGARSPWLSAAPGCCGTEALRAA
jgi:hypothetical protein